MRSLPGRVYLLILGRFVRRIDVSVATVEKVTGDIFTVIDEFWRPTVTNHVLDDSSAGGALPPVSTPGRPS